MSCFFFFQAEDGIRDYKVTGVQTCALPIWRSCQERKAAGAASDWTPITLTAGLIAFATMQAPAAPLPPPTGTTITSIRGSSSRISIVSVATPAISSGSLAECTYRYH